MEAIRQIDLKVNARKTDKAVLRRLSHAFVENLLSVPCLHGTSIADPLKRKEAHSL